MYLEHFGLKEPPFRITPHTDFFFDGANRGATLDALVYAITHDEGIVKVSGEVGSGKTMLCRVLMERLPESVTIVYLANPSLSRDDILYAIADELRLEIPDNARTSVVMRALQDQLIQSYSEGKQVVVLIDEAHAMPADTLEEIRLLSNLESNHSKLLQLVLFGQPELNDILARPDMRQLKERITHNFGLEPLVRDDIASYLEFRMRTAGYRGPSVFSPAALKLIAQSSLGLTRRINIIADKSLLAAFSAGTHLIGNKEAQAAIRDCEFSEATYGAGSRRQPRILWPWLTLVVGLAATAALVWLARSDTVPLPVAAPAPAPAGAVSPPPGASPAPDGASPKQAVGAVTTQQQDAPTAPAAPAMLQGTGTAPAQEFAAPAPIPAKAPAGSVPVDPGDGKAKKLGGTASLPEKSSTLTNEKLGPLTRERLESSREWLRGLPNDRWFIQLFAANADRHGEVELLLRRLAADGVDMDKIRVYHSDLSGAPRYGVIYAEYPSRRSAAAAMRKLPKVMQVNQPYPRQAIRLR